MITASDGATIMQMSVPQAAESTGAAPVTVAVVVPPAANTENLVWHMILNDRLQQSTIQEGYVTINVTAALPSGGRVTLLDAPIQILLPALPADGILAYSQDGIMWTSIPQMLGSSLPDDAPDGYFVEADGTVALFTRHLTSFGIRKPQASLELSVVNIDIVSGSVSRAVGTGGTSEDPIRYNTLSDSGVCTVTDSGLIYGVSAGICTLVAIRGGGSIYLDTSSSPISTKVVSAIVPLVPPVNNLPLMLQLMALIALCVLLGILGKGAWLTILGYRSNTTGVIFGGTAGTSLTDVSATSVTVVTPTKTAGALDVVWTTPDGSATATDGYTFIAAPTITSVSPSSGPIAGGTSVTITGTNLTGTTGVTFGGTAGTSVSVVSATSVTVTTPSGTAGAVNVVLTTPGGSATSAGGFTYIVAPTIWSVSPSSGPTAGGTAVTITGTNLTGTTSVTFGGTAGTSVNVVSATSVTVTTPSGRADAVNVMLTTPGGTATSTDGYTYVAPPTVSGTAATSVGTTTANLTGSVNANLASTTVSFEYGTASNLSGSTTVSAAESPVSGSTDTSVSRALTGLSTGTTYYFRIVATNANGATTGPIVSFTTSVIAATASVSVVAGDGVLEAAVSSVQTNGAVISAIEYQVDGGAWISTGLTGAGDFTISSLGGGTSYSVVIRVTSNGVGSPTVSSAVTGTPAVPTTTTTTTTILAPPIASPSTTTTIPPTTTTTIPQPVPATTTTVPAPTTTTTIPPLFEAANVITASDGATIMQMSVPQAAGSTGAAPVTVAVVVPPAANTKNLVWHMMLNDRLQQSTIQEGYVTINVTAALPSGDRGTLLDAPIQILLPAPPAEGLPRLWLTIFL